jgi:hypothetical protein
MVWFDCECGESLKKPSVAKHMQIKRCSYVTCVDCSTTFHGSDFETHIRCISEAQKYMGKLYDESSAKREGVKQDSWIEAVSSALSSYQGPLRHLVDKLAMYDNIPRKQKPFMNFVANSLNLKRDQATVSKLWDIVSQATSSNVAPVKSVNAGNIKPWTSYREETTDILKSNNGSMPWKLLQANLTKRRKTTHPTEEYEFIRLDVLANIPSEYLRSDSPLVSIQ